MVAMTTALVLFGILLAGPANGDPYCPALLDPAALKNEYRRMAPIHSNRDNGWIFVSSHLQNSYTMEPEAEMLLRSIVEEFKSRQLPLAILIAPPRPAMVGQRVLDETLMGRGNYSAAAAGDSFSSLIAQIRAAGAIAPDVYAQSRNHAVIAERFYFKRDDHWSTMGAAFSASELAREVHKSLPDLFVSAKPLDLPSLESREVVEEKGSYNQMVEATCGFRPAG
jgi:hypothetical protein